MNLVFRIDKLGNFCRSGVVLKIENLDDGDSFLLEFILNLIQNFQIQFI